MDNTIRAVQVFGLTSSLVLAGINIGSSGLALPILYTRPTSVSTPFFKEFYVRGAVSLVPLGVVSAASSAVVAYLLPSQRSLWSLASAATFAQTPWTLIVMMSTNKRLIAIADSNVEQEKATKEEVTGLLQGWAWMNVVRGSLAFVGGLAGVWAITENQK